MSAFGSICRAHFQRTLSRVLLMHYIPKSAIITVTLLEKGEISPN